MTRIRSDGTIDRHTNTHSFPRDCRTSSSLWEQFQNLSTSWKVGLLSIVFWIIHHKTHDYYWNPNPLRNGTIPASLMLPYQHWNRIVNDDGFVRTMTAHLGKNTYWKGRQHDLTTLQQGDHRTKVGMDVMLDRIDFGGPDGHIPERGDWSDIKYYQGTRCATTRSALTAYFCGSTVAENQDKALGPRRKPTNFGVQELTNFIQCRHGQGQALPKGQHRRSVYRIGIGCKDALARYSHAFSIIALPDGTFYWLQSYIGHYSLQQWMTTMQGHHQAHFTLQELLAKFRQVERLMNIQGWTTEANQDYLECFGVDKEKEAMRRNKRPVRDTWKPSHRLQYFSWDEACEFPLPAELSANTNHAGSGSSVRDKNDQCVMDNYLQQLKLHGIRVSGSKQKKIHRRSLVSSLIRIELFGCKLQHSL